VHRVPCQIVEHDVPLRGTAQPAVVERRHNLRL
jgi:hypothetical protein